MSVFFVRTNLALQIALPETHHLIDTNMSKRQWQDRTNNDRHYCPLCNAWMASDRQSISLHENGKKHREAVEKDLTRRRDEKKRKEKEERDLESVFRAVNAAAYGGGVAAVPSSGVTSSGFVQQPVQQLPKPKAAKPVKPKAVTSSEIKPAPAPSSIKSIPISTVPDKDTGHYELEGIIYLEGSTYASCLEDNIPVQLWTGNPNATDVELRDLRNFNYWKTALLVRVIRTQTTNKGSETITCHVSHLNNSQDEEVLEKNVSPRRIRLVLGSDPSLPSTLEEARLALTGGEQTVMVSNDDDKEPEIDENTGFSTWSTTTVTKISTHYYEAHQEKKRKLRQEKETKERNEKKEHEIAGRKMEEAKYENAHDSALGAYDVFQKGGGNYKGVDITKDGKVEVGDTAKSLSKGLGNVGFKKRKVVKKGTRKTSADEI